ncbi:MAG: hypothetical protein AB7F35_21065 [Acetobacteraceae bacterium]
MSPTKRLLAALIFALPVASLVVPPAMAQTDPAGTTQTQKQTKKKKKSGKTHAKAKKKSSAQTG